MSVSKWVCYTLASVDSQKTYVGATDNLYRRLCDHNGLHGKSKGAKATKGEMWYPLFVVTGFTHKNACLSFESSLRKIRSRKCYKKYTISYGKTSHAKRLINLLNLLYSPSILGKWKPEQLHIIWLEKELRTKMLDLKIPCQVSESYDFKDL